MSADFAPIAHRSGDKSGQRCPLSRGDAILMDQPHRGHHEEALWTSCWMGTR
jgi:hypothetical protein